MTIFYIILIIIAVYVYSIYKSQNPKLTKEEVKEKIQEEIDLKEEYLLKKIKTSILKDYMQTETTLFDCGRRNFLRLKERFKHDDIKYAQIVKDWLDYMETLSDIVFESEMLDVCTSEESEEHYKRRDELFVVVQETEKRFKELLGSEYDDPDKILNPQNYKK